MLYAQIYVLYKKIIYNKYKVPVEGTNTTISSTNYNNSFHFFLIFGDHLLQLTDSRTVNRPVTLRALGKTRVELTRIIFTITYSFDRLELILFSWQLALVLRTPTLFLAISIIVTPNTYPCFTFFSLIKWVESVQALL